MKTTPEFNAAFANFMSLLQAKVDALYAEGYSPALPSICGTKFEFEVGKVRTRIVAQQMLHGKKGPSRSAYAFVDHATGDILKAASWNAPAKHARGNIFNANPVECCGQYGMAYLR